MGKTRATIPVVILRGISALLLLSGPLLSAHNTLLPSPQETRYGPGKLMVAGIEVQIGGNPAPEDRFAAAELAAWLAEASGTAVPVIEGPSREGAKAVILKRTGGIDALPVPGDRGGPESREAYEIRITPQAAFITARSSAGLYWAAQTLRQMIEGRGADAFLPEAEIRDWPELPYRGYMMDFSHAQLPTVAEVKRQIDFLARWKTNQYLFYSEASIELDGFPTLMAEARYTQAEVREVIEYARARHIDIIPNMELYGHLHDLFRMEKYSDLAVIPHGGEFNRRSPRIKPLLEDWIGQVARLFPSPFFHIGFDETWLLSREAARLKAEPGELYLGLLREVAVIVERNGKKPLAYADMIQKFPSIAVDMPRGLTAVAWHYFPLQEAEYDRLLGPLTSNGIPLILQSAVINWHWLVTDYDTSFRNIDALAAAAKKHNSLGLYQSGWTDDTQTLTKPGWPAWAYASIAGWQGKTPDRGSFFSDYAALLYPKDIAAEAALALGALARAETLLQQATRRETIRAFFDDPFTKERLEKSGRESQTLCETRLAADEALAHIIKAQRTGVDPDTFKSLEACVRMIDFTALKHIYAREIADFWDQLGPNPDPKDALNLIHNEVSYKYHTRTSDMMDALSVIRDRFREGWLAEFAPFRLNIALAKFDVELQAWWKLQRRLTSVTEKLAQGLPSLDSLTADLWE